MANAYFTNRGKKVILNAYFRADSSDEPTGFKAALVIEKSNPDKLDNAAAVDKGGGKVGIPITGHAYAAGDQIVIDGTTNYDDTYIINSQTANEIVITETYVSETFAGTEDIWEIPGPDTNILADLDEVAVGNGYNAGGKAIARTAVGFDVITEDDDNDLGKIQLADVEWLASGGPIPSDSVGARFLLLLDDAATPNVLCWWDLLSSRVVSDGQTLRFQDAEVQAVTAS